jgi:signal transduction histidine kinase
MDRRHRQPALTRYAVAIAAVACAWMLSSVLFRFGDTSVATVFLAAVIVSAWYGGIGPGLMATALSGALSPLYLPHPEGIREIVFLIISVLICLLQEANRRTHAESDRARIAAESANAAKGLFLGMVSHELRAPLNPILLEAQLVERDPSASEQILASARNIQRNVQIEARLIDDLLDLTRAGSGKLVLKRTRLDLEQPLDAAVQILLPDLEAKEIVLHRESQHGHVVDGDPVRLQQVFWNLLRNAIKFTPKGGTIRVRMSDAPGAVIARITDTGIGIEADQAETIFDAFAQGGAEVTQKYGGLGLGLAICKAIVIAHGGSIGVSSPGRGKGTEFTVRLPAPVPASSVPIQTGSAANPAAAGI